MLESVSRAGHPAATSPEARRDIDELSVRIVNRRENLVARGKKRVADKRGHKDNTRPSRIPAATIPGSR